MHFVQTKTFDLPPDRAEELALLDKVESLIVYGHYEQAIVTIIKRRDRLTTDLDLKAYGT